MKWNCFRLNQQSIQKKNYFQKNFTFLYLQDNFNYSRRRSRAILNELSGRYIQNKRPGRQKLLDKVYSSCDNSALPIYKPQLEVGFCCFFADFSINIKCWIYFRNLSDVSLLIMEPSGNAGIVSFYLQSCMLQP